MTVLCDNCSPRKGCTAEKNRTECRFYQPQTNEEWRKTCSTEEFTEELAKVVLDLIAWNNDPKPSEVRNILKAWLQRPHREE